MHPPSPNETQEHFSNSSYEDAIADELEERDNGIAKNVFWVPALARWKTLQDSAKLPAGTGIVAKGAQASRQSLQDAKATGSDKDTGKMPVDKPMAGHNLMHAIARKSEGDFTAKVAEERKAGFFEVILFFARLGGSLLGGGGGAGCSAGEGGWAARAFPWL